MGGAAWWLESTGPACHNAWFTCMHASPHQCSHRRTVGSDPDPLPSVSSCRSCVDTAAVVAAAVARVLAPAARYGSLVRFKAGAVSLCVVRRLSGSVGAAVTVVTAWPSCVPTAAVVVSGGRADAVLVVPTPVSIISIIAIAVSMRMT